MSKDNSNRNRNKPNKNTVFSVYLKSVLTTKITLHVTEIGKQLIENLHKKLVMKVSGKCIEEGYIRSSNILILQHSSGSVSSENITFHVSYECDVCHPVEGMNIVAKIFSTTKVGLHCQVIDPDGTIPITVFVARDHNFKNDLFHEVKENDMITVKVIGIRYELNDPFICVIANIIGIGEIGQQGGVDDNIGKEVVGNQNDVMDIDLDQ